MKLLPFRRVLCTPHNHAPCHFMQSQIRKVYARLTVTCHLRFWQNDRGLLRVTAVTRGVERIPKQESAQKGDSGEEILPPLHQGFELPTFWSRVRRSNHWATPAHIQTEERAVCEACRATKLCSNRSLIINLRMFPEYFLTALGLLKTKP